MAKYCPKCSKEFSDTDNFCDECGGKLKEKEIEKEEYVKTEKKHLNWLWVGIGVGVILILIVVFIFVIPMPYTTTEVYTEKAPYEAQETYTETEPYTKSERVPLTYEVVRGEKSDGWTTLALEPYYYQDIFVKNTDNEAGDFVVYCVFLQAGRKMAVNGIKYLNPNEEGKASCESITESTYDILNTVEIEPSSKTVQTTSYRDVEKTRTVTKYRDIDKERKVTEYTSLWKQWTG